MKARLWPVSPFPSAYLIETKDLDDDTAKKLEAAIKEFQGQFAGKKKQEAVLV